MVEKEKKVSKPSYTSVQVPDGRAKWPQRGGELYQRRVVKGVNSGSRTDAERGELYQHRPKVLFSAVERPAPDGWNGSILFNP